MAQKAGPITGVSSGFGSEMAGKLLARGDKIVGSAHGPSFHHGSSKAAEAEALSPAHEAAASEPSGRRYGVLPRQNDDERKRDETA